MLGVVLTWALDVLAILKGDKKHIYPSKGGGGGGVSIAKGFTLS